MTTPFDRVRRGLIILAVVFVVSVLGYRSAGYPWVEAVWMVVITIASVVSVGRFIPATHRQVGPAGVMVLRPFENGGGGRPKMVALVR